MVGWVGEHESVGHAGFGVSKSTLRATGRTSVELWPKTVIFQGVVGHNGVLAAQEQRWKCCGRKGDTGED